MTNEQIKEIIARAEDEHEYLKDRVHDLYDENVKLKEEYVMLQNASDEIEEEKDKEIERLNKENERIRTELNGNESIIKEIREYIEKELGNINTNENILAQGICLKIKEIIGSDKYDRRRTNISKT